jgi:hypothetical protein
MMSTLRTATRRGLNLGRPQILRSCILLLDMEFFVQNSGNVSGIPAHVILQNCGLSLYFIVYGYNTHMY